MAPQRAVLGDVCVCEGGGFIYGSSHGTMGSQKGGMFSVWVLKCLVGVKCEMGRGVLHYFTLAGFPSAV